MFSPGAGGVYSMPLCVTNNNPMIFTERAGGVARRRVIFRFDNIVSEAEKDRELPDIHARKLSPLASWPC